MNILQDSSKVKELVMYYWFPNLFDPHMYFNNILIWLTIIILNSKFVI